MNYNEQTNQKLHCRELCRRKPTAEGVAVPRRLGANLSRVAQTGGERRTQGSAPAPAPGNEEGFFAKHLSSLHAAATLPSRANPAKTHSALALRKGVWPSTVTNKDIFAEKSQVAKLFNRKFGASGWPCVPLVSYALRVCFLKPGRL